MIPGAKIRVRTDLLPAVDSDIRAWCRTTRHELVEGEAAAGARDYLVRKAGEPSERPGWAIVISNPGLEELLSPLGFALGAALAGSPAAIYGGGWRRPGAPAAREAAPAR